MGDAFDDAAALAQMIDWEDHDMRLNEERVDDIDQLLSSPMFERKTESNLRSTGMAKKKEKANVVAGEVDQTTKFPFRTSKPSARLKKINMLNYAKSGIGKTVLAGSVAEVEAMKPILFMDIEGGTMPLNEFGYTDVEIVDINHWDDLYDVVEYLQSDANIFKTAVADSITELQKYCMAAILEANGRDEPQIKDWGTNASYMRNVIRTFRDMDIHFIATCLETADKDERTGAVTLAPALPGKLAAELPSYFDITGRLTAQEDKEGEVQRILKLTSTEGYLAKDRTHRLGGSIENPTMLDIYNRIMKTEEK